MLVKMSSQIAGWVLSILNRVMIGNSKVGTKIKVIND